MCTITRRVLTTHDITFMKSHGYGAPDPLESPSQVQLCYMPKQVNATGKTWGQQRSTQWRLTETLSALLVFLSRSMSLLGAVMQAGLKLLSKPRADEFGSPWPERASAARSAQRPKIRLGHPRQAATMTLALDGGTGHTRGAPMPGPRRCRWTYTGSPGVSPSRQPACAGTE